jgi:hypothetical protein
MRKAELKTDIRNLKCQLHAQKVRGDCLSKKAEFLEQTLRSCESACIYHQERSEKAFEIIGRLMVEGELDAEAL